MDKKDSKTIIEFAGQLNSILATAMCIEFENKEIKIMFIQATNKIWDSINLNIPETLDYLIRDVLDSEQLKEHGKNRE